MRALGKLAKRLRRIRKKQGLSHAALADGARLTKAYVIRLEGEQQDPRLSVVERLAKSLRVTIGKLVD
jgi:transcriptional regulator with XRE-family HTH domain